MDLYNRFRQKPRHAVRITSILFLCHPSVAALYYIGVLTLIFTFNHPVFMLSAFALMFLQVSYLLSLRVATNHIKSYLLLGMVIALINPVFNHRGVTILFYFFDRPITLEAFAYGVYLFMLIITMLIIFVSINNVMGMSKILYLFSSTLPQISFLTSMTLRYGELFKQQAQEYRGIQNTREPSVKISKLAKTKNASNMLAGFFSSSLESGMVVSETLKAKEYGKHKRTHYQKYKMSGLDFSFVSLMLILGTGMVIGKSCGLGNIDYYKDLHISLEGNKLFTFYLIYMMFLLLPIIIDGFYYLKRKCDQWN